MCHSAKLSSDYFKPIAAFLIFLSLLLSSLSLLSRKQLMSTNNIQLSKSCHQRESQGFTEWQLLSLSAASPSFLRRRRSGCDCDGSKAKKKKKKKRKKDRRKPFIKTMPHHRKPCTHGTNTPPCFIAAVSSHWCSHREICLDAFAGSDAKNSHCQRAEYVVVGSCFFFFFLPLFLSSVYLPISCVQEAGIRFIFTFRWKDTHQGHKHTSPANSRAFQSIAADKS